MTVRIKGSIDSEDDSRSGRLESFQGSSFHDFHINSQVNCKNVAISGRPREPSCGEGWRNYIHFVSALALSWTMVRAKLGANSSTFFCERRKSVQYHLRMGTSIDCHRTSSLPSTRLGVLIGSAALAVTRLIHIPARRNGDSCLEKKFGHMIQTISSSGRLILHPGTYQTIAGRRSDR